MPRQRRPSQLTEAEADALDRKLSMRPSPGGVQRSNMLNTGVAARIARAQRSLEKNFTSDRVGHLLESRGEVEDLEKTNVLKDTRIAPAIQGPQEALKKSLAKANLYHALARRPSVVELIETGLFVPQEEEDYENYYASAKFNKDGEESSEEEESDSEAASSDIDYEIDTAQGGYVQRGPAYENEYLRSDDNEEFSNSGDDAYADQHDDDAYGEQHDDDNDEAYAEQYEQFLMDRQEEEYQQWLLDRETALAAAQDNFSPTARDNGYFLDTGFDDEYYNSDDYESEPEEYNEAYEEYLAERAAAEAEGEERDEEEDVIYDESGHAHYTGDDDAEYYGDGYGEYDPYSQYVTELYEDEQVYADEAGNYYVDRGYEYLVPVHPAAVDGEEEEEEDEDGYVWLDEEGQAHNPDDVYVDDEGNYFAYQPDEQEDEDLEDTAAAAEARSYQYYYTRLLLQVVAGMGRVGELSIFQKGLLKDMIVDQVPEIIGLAEDYLQTNDELFLKEGLIALVSSRE